MHPLLGKLIRYGLTGGIAAIVDAGGFALLIRTGGPLALMAAISFCTAAAVNYLLTSRIVFSQQPSRRGFALFFGIALIGLAINVGVTVAGTALLGLPPVAAKIVAIAVAFLVNFALNVLIVFRQA